VKNITTFLCVLLFSGLSFAAVPSPSKMTRVSKPASNQVPLPDNIVFDEIVEAYRGGNLKRLSEKAEILVSNMPQSTYADNAIYLKGLLLLSRNNYVGALASFEKILKDYPQSNKAVGALFAKGVAYKRMSLMPQARQILERVKKTYPGSTEAYRAEFELKVFNELPKKSKNQNPVKKG
jgi:TolA-binding protein